MSDYTCNLKLTSKKDVVTEWSQAKPEFFSVGDTIHFTSTQGDWRVEFANSPFKSTAVPQTFSAVISQERAEAIVRGSNDYPFQCFLVVRGETYGYQNGAAGDDIRVRP